MSDFYQNGVVTVLHRLGQPNVDQLERELARYGQVNPIALVLPSLYAELGRPALKAIVDTLKNVSYLNEIVISLDRASALEFRLAKQFFSVLPQRVRLIWNDGARIQSILKLLVDQPRHRPAREGTRMLDRLRLCTGPKPQPGHRAP